MVLFYDDLKKYTVPGYVINAIVNLKAACDKNNVIKAGEIIGEIFTIISEKQLDEVNVDNI